MFFVERSIILRLRWSTIRSYSYCGLFLTPHCWF